MMLKPKEFNRNSPYSPVFVYSCIGYISLWLFMKHCKTVMYVYYYLAIYVQLYVASPHLLIYWGFYCKAKLARDLIGIPCSYGVFGNGNFWEKMHKYEWVSFSDNIWRIQIYFEAFWYYPCVCLVLLFI